MPDNRSAPRISVNKLGEYLVAPPTRRRQILRDQRHPPTYQVIRYTDAEDAIVASLLGRSAERNNSLASAVAALKAVAPQSGYDEQRIGLCVEAIEAFMKIELDLSDVEVAHPPVGSQTLSIAEVTVSVRPNLQINTTDRQGRAKVGLIKLHFSKTFQLEEKGGAYVAALLRRFSEAYLSEAGAPSLQNTLVVDVFAGEIYEAPVAITRRMTDIEAACEEIHARWQTL